MNDAMKVGQWIIVREGGTINVWEITERRTATLQIKNADRLENIWRNSPRALATFNERADAERACEVLLGLKTVFDDAIAELETKRDAAVYALAKQWGTKH